MSLGIGFALAIICSVVWVTADALRKRITAHFDALELAVCLHWIQLPLLALLLGVPFVWPQSEWGQSFVWELQPGYWLPAMPTIVCNALANVLFLRALQLSDLSLSVPYLSLTPVMAMFSGWLVVGEVPTFIGMVGVCTIGLGALVLNPGKREGGRFRPIQTLLNEKGSLAMLGVGALWSISVAFDKAAVNLSNPLTHAAVLALTGGFILEMMRRRKPSHEFMARFLRAWLLVIVTTSVITAALFVQLAAYEFIEVAYVEAMKRSIGLVGSVLIGWLIFKESDVAQRLFGVCVMAIGVCLILFATN